MRTTVLSATALCWLLASACDDGLASESAVETTDGASQAVACGAACERVLIDFSELKPSATPRRLPVFTDGTLTRGGCFFDYALTAVAQAALPAQPDSQVKANFGGAPWVLTSWVTNPAYVNLCSPTSTAGSANGASWLRTPGKSGQPALALAFHQDRLAMAQRSVDFWQSVFGAPLFRSKSDYLNTGWPNVFIGRKLSGDEIVPLSTMGALRLRLDAMLAYVNVNTTQVPAPAELPVGAQTTYDARIHATQFRLAVLVQWRLTKEQYATCLVPDASTGKLVFSKTAQPYCMHHGRYMDLMLHLFDERFQYFSTWTPTWFGGAPSPTTMHDLGTNTMMWRESLEALMSPAQRALWFEQKKQNPYRIEGERFAIDVDLLPIVKRALIAARAMSVVDPVSGQTMPALPPRLTLANGALETEIESLGHYVVSGANLGYEVSGLSQTVFNVYELTLKARLANH